MAGSTQIDSAPPRSTKKRRNFMSPPIIALLILLLCVVLFLTERVPNAVTACLGCVLMVLCRVCTFEEAFSGFSSSIVLLLAGSMVVGSAMFHTGAAQLIGARVLALSGGNGRLFLLIGGSIAGILAMFLANNAVIAAFLPLIDSICGTSPELDRRDLTLPVACCTMFGGACTLVGCTPQLTANGMLREMTGLELGMWDLTGPGLCLTVVCVAYLTLFGFGRGRKIWGGRRGEEGQPGAADPAEHPVRDRRKIIIVFLIMAAMIVFYIGAWLSTAMTALCAAILCVLSGCCDVKRLASQINWECLVFLAGCLGLANGLTASGAGSMMAERLFALLGASVSPMWVFALLVFATLLISQIITNSTAIIITLPVALSLCSAYGFSHVAFCLGIVFGGSLACSTPLAAAQITVTQSAGYRFFDYFRYTWPLAVLSYVGILIFVPLFFPLVL